MGATLGAMFDLRTLFGLPILSLALACGGGMRVQTIDLERPPEDLGLPPPATPDYQACYSGRAEHLDTNGDGRNDHVRVRDDAGNDVCHGVDSNHDGRVDQWDVMKDGQVAKRAKDADHDGDVDEHWTFNPGNTQCAMVAYDHNSDGTADTQPVDSCATGTSSLQPPVTPAPAPAPAPSTTTAP